MKELSIEEKAKRYDEVVARLRHAFNSNRCTLGFMNEILRYPKESEGERISKKIKKVLNWYRKSFSEKSLRNEEYDEMFAWIEKQGKQKPAWSEEDEKIRQNLMSLLSDMRRHRIEESTYQKYYPWLKSLKDRYTWKPSDEQMSALEYIINNAHNTSYSCKIAKELLEQLRRLKGE